MTDHISRRDFIKSAALGTMALGMAAGVKAGPGEAAATGIIPKRKFGKNPMEVTIIGLGGGSNFLKADDETRTAILEKAISMGVNYFDSAAMYGKNRDSEKAYGQVLPKYRDNIYITSKSEDRTYDGAMRSVEESLKHLKTDYIDVFHVHAVKAIEKENIEKWGEKDGVVAALRKLRDEKVIRCMALSGHDSPESLKKAIETYDFDSALIAMNATERKAFQEIAMTAAAKQNMGIVAMKTTRGLVGQGDGKASPKDLLGWIWSQPLHVAIVGMGSLDMLEQNVELARSFEPGSTDTEKLTAALAPVVSNEQMEWAVPGHVDV